MFKELVEWSSASPSPARCRGHLTVSGNQILDVSRKPFTLRGVSLFWSQWQPEYFNAPLIYWLRDDWGINVIRVPLAVQEGGYLTHPERERRKIETVLQAAIAAGVYVIVDWHSHHPEPAAAVEFFSSIAAKYCNYPNIIYEIWNEPIDCYGWENEIKPYHELVGGNIRLFDKNNLIVLGTPSWSRDVDVAANDPVALNNVAYSLHFYAASHGNALRHKAELALRMGAPLIATEWGTCEANGDGKLAFPEVRKWLRFLNRNHIGYVNWSISAARETSAALSPGAPVCGNWAKSDLTPSGQLVRKELRRAAHLRWPSRSVNQVHL